MSRLSLVSLRRELGGSPKGLEVAAGEEQRALIIIFWQRSHKKKKKKPKGSSSIFIGGDYVQASARR